MFSRRIRVLIVDDSILVRHILSHELGQAPDLEIIGTAANAGEAQEKIRAARPDVVVLDIEMPGMNGLTLLRHQMNVSPLPVIILSSLAESGTRVALDALESGAFEVLAKPKCDVRNGMTEVMHELTEAIRAAARAKIKIGAYRPLATSRPARVEKRVAHAPAERIIAIGASTGGTEAVRSILTQLPADAPGVMVVIHMPEVFTQQYARRLDDLCAMDVREAADGDEICTGTALIARGGHHLAAVRTGGRYVARVTRGPRVSRHCPSVDVLFSSMAECAKGNSLGIILTGMGNDGAKGLLAMRDAGAATLAQDESTCVVFGMPREAIELGAAGAVARLDQVAGKCVQWMRGGANP
jgi:two-component system chemotaxis response regulator CheB